MDAKVTWPEEKRCFHCKHLKPAAEFYKEKHHRDGLSSWCRTCIQARRVYTGPALEEKRCGRCKNTKKASEFDKEKKGTGGLSRWCKPCKSAYQKAHNAKPEVKAATRNRQLGYLYGITIEDYNRMLAAQGGGCAICGVKPTNKRALHVDHDHSCCPGSKTCGKCVRGLLCRQCNHKILGYWLHEGAKGTEQALRKARNLVAYLERGSVNA